MGIKARNIVVLIFVCFVVQLFAQQDTASFHQIKIEKGMTLYSISKQYGVSASDILNLNPDAQKDGLKIGQTIQIPKIKTQNQKKELPNYHKVGKAETLYGIARQYEISLNQLRNLNEKVLQGGLKEGLELRLNDKIPEKLELINLISNPQNTSILSLQNPKFVISEQGTTLYNVSKKFNVQLDSLLKFNTKFLSKGVQPGDTIYLKNNTKQNQDTQIAGKPENKITKNDSIYAIVGKLLGNQKSDEEIKTVAEITPPKADEPLNSINKTDIALLLPFKSKQYRDLINKYLLYGDSAIIRILSNELATETKIAFEILNGFILGLDSTTKSSDKFNIYVFDSHDDSLSVNQLKNNQAFNKCKIVVGPIFGNIFNVINNAFPQKLFINPFSRLDNYNYTGKQIIKLTPYNSELVEITAKTLANQFSEHKKLIIYNENIEEIDFVTIVKKDLTENQTNHYIKQTSENLNTKLHQLTDSDSLIIFIPSLRQMNITSLVNKIRPYVKNKNIRLVGFEIWEHFDNLDIEQLNNLNFTYLGTEYIDVTSEKTKQFIKNYYYRYNNQPSKYAFWGHDIALISENLLSNNKINDIKLDGLIKNIELKLINSESKSGKNQGYFLITYSDFVRQAVKLVRN